MASLLSAETAAGAAPFGPPRMRSVVARRRETRDTVTLVVDDPGGPRFAPGQFNMLWGFGHGEVPISMSGDPAEAGRLTHTIRSVGLATDFLTRLAPGDPVGVRGPFGRPWPVAEARGSDVLFVAGGLGMAPLKPAVHAVLADRAAYGRVTLLHGARTPGDLLFPTVLAGWRQRLDVSVEVTVDAAAPGWRGNVGVVTTLFRRIAVDPDHAVAMVCGPEIMMRFAVKSLLDMGLGPEAIHVSLERNMQCGAGVCGHCQLGPFLVCRDGAVFSVAELGQFFGMEEA